MVTEAKSRNRIRDVRTQRGISQTELGLRVGMSEPTINRYENGGRRPSREMFNAIADALGVPLKDLFVDPTHGMSEGNGENDRFEGDGNGSVDDDGCTG